MSAVKHAPCPWRAERHGDPSHGWGVYAPDTSEHADPEGVVCIAEFLTEANAKAMAASPDLLGALKAQSCSQCMSMEPDEDVCDACRLKRAAIAKAEGRS